MICQQALASAIPYESPITASPSTKAGTNFIGLSFINSVTHKVRWLNLVSSRYIFTTKQLTQVQRTGSKQTVLYRDQTARPWGGWPPCTHNRCLQEIIIQFTRRNQRNDEGGVRAEPDRGEERAARTFEVERDADAVGAGTAPVRVQNRPCRRRLRQSHTQLPAARSGRCGFVAGGQWRSGPRQRSVGEVEPEAKWDTEIMKRQPNPSSSV